MLPHVQLIRYFTPTEAREGFRTAAGAEAEEAEPTGGRFEPRTMYAHRSVALFLLLHSE